MTPHFLRFFAERGSRSAAILRAWLRSSEIVLQSIAGPEQLAQAAPAAHGAVETVTVTSSKLGGADVQSIPISITALSQEQLTATQTAGGPDLVKQVPNMSFTKTNFSGYSIQLRGIGTQAISVTTDPAVAVAFNDIPFIRNHFFEQEFYDVSQVEVLRGPQGTLYGRNATAGVVNLISAKPTDQFEAMASADIGNYGNRRFEGMINLPIVGDKLDIRLAGEWTKRDGYTEDTTLNTSVDGRDLWSGRATIAFNPNSYFHSDLVWEHFSEDDNRLRSGKQLCETAPPPTTINGVAVPGPGIGAHVDGLNLNASYLSQGCQATSLYAPTAFQVPYGPSLPYIIGLQTSGLENVGIDPYAETTQSRNLRDIQSAILPRYRAKNDTVEYNADYALNPELTFISSTGYNQDSLYSTEDYNRFDTSPGLFQQTEGGNVPCSATVTACVLPDPNLPGDSIFCDPQLGCSDRLIVQDLNVEHAWQLSQEFRLASSFKGPFNFSVGGSYLHYETEENYYVFSNAFTATALEFAGGSGGGGGYPPRNCVENGDRHGSGYQSPNPIGGGGQITQDCIYIDPNPISSLNNEGHNYFVSKNPYTLNSYAVFGEAYYNVTDDLKLTGGIRWTVDRKHFVNIPSELLDQGYGFWTDPPENQEWDRPTGRAVLNWTPETSFSDQSLFYASYAHGYKAGGANPPGAIFAEIGASNTPFIVHPLTFKPEYIEAFEAGTKNTFLDGTLTVNADAFYYNYTGYQISEIVDRTAINNNYNAHVKGAELESTWEPSPGLKFNFAGGWEQTAIAGGTYGIDLMDRTAGTPGWMVVKPFATAASNCILPTYVVAAAIQQTVGAASYDPGVGPDLCQAAYTALIDPITLCPYVSNPTAFCNTGRFNIPPFIPAGYPGFNPLNPAINNGEGFAKNLSGHKLPNAPPFTASFGSQYTLPIIDDWAATFRGDFYFQAATWARVFNDNPYDHIKGYTNVNLSVTVASSDGWQVMGYVKNVFDTTAITGDFLNSDNSGLTTNVFLTDPRLFGIRVTKDFGAGDSGALLDGENYIADLFSDAGGGKPHLWIELGGQAEYINGQGDVFTPAFLALYPTSPVLHNVSPTQEQRPSLFSYGEEARVSFQPDDSDWVFSAAVRYGRSGNSTQVHHQTTGVHQQKYVSGVPQPTNVLFTNEKFATTTVTHQESHTILDFMAGKDVGLGMFGLDGTSTISGGVRSAQFGSKATVDIRARPDMNFVTFNSPPILVYINPYFHDYHFTGEATRTFQGIGPSIAWDASTPVAGEPQDGEITFDWGANAAVLFGKQKSRVKHSEYGRDFPSSGFGQYKNSFISYQKTGGHNSDKARAVPNLGAFAGASYRFNNARISFGYRADVFFGALDGGVDAPKNQTTGFYGPFAKISLGL